MNPVEAKFRNFPLMGCFFLIYINDIQYAVTDAKVKLFADDTNLFLYGNSLSELEVTENNGVRGKVHARFHSYLSNRQQTTLYSGVYSDFETVTCGVPQGLSLIHI